MLATLKLKLYKIFNGIDIKKCSLKHIKSNLINYNTKLHIEYRPFYVEFDVLHIDSKFWSNLIEECKNEIIDLTARKNITLSIIDMKIPVSNYFESEEGKYITSRIAYSYSDSYDFDKWCIDLQYFLPKHTVYYLDVNTMKILLDGYNNIKKAINQTDIDNEIQVLIIELPKLYNYIYYSNFSKIFCKLGSMSSKRDRKLNPLVNIDQILLFLITSEEFAIEYLYRIKTNKSLSLIFMEWNDDIENSLEYRVFVHNKKVTGISQQKFIKFKDLNDNMVKQHSNTITEYINKKICPNMKYQSAVLDIWIDEKGECHLIEINPWGEFSGTSSSLFNWINDLDQLYGKNNVVNVRYIVE